MFTSRDKRKQRFAEDPLFCEQVRAEKRAWHAANKDRVNAERRRQYAEDPSRKLTQRAYIAANGRKIMLKCCYGMTPADYEALLARQNGVCAICKTTEPGRPLYVDHCHVRKKVRGLLCRSCNLGLGNFKDDPRLLRAATAYLEFHCDAVDPPHVVGRISAPPPWRRQA